MMDDSAYATVPWFLYKCKTKNFVGLRQQYTLLELLLVRFVISWRRTIKTSHVLYTAGIPSERMCSERHIDRSSCGMMWRD